MDDISREKQRERVSRYRKTPGGREATRRAVQKHREKTKTEVFYAMGGMCECCEVTGLAFLTIAHVMNDGGGRNRAKTGYSLWCEVRASGYDKTRYSLLCFNCNTGAHINGGVCPHQDKD